MHEVEDVGEQRGVRGLVPRQGLQQLPGAGHLERQHQPVSLGESQRPFGGLIRRPLITELTVGQPGQQLRLHDRDVPDDRRRAVQDIPHRAQSPGRSPSARQITARALPISPEPAISSASAASAARASPAIPRRARVASIQPLIWLARASELAN